MPLSWEDRLRLMTSHQQLHYDRQIASWLLFCAAIILGMILLGGVTRLTHSGLSMVEWKPLMGVVPPLSEHAWQETFDKYKQFPEYRKVNLGMDLAGFKAIFMFEYLHRLLGRAIGLVFFFPLVYFAWRGCIRPGLMPRLLTLLVMGGLQGLLGWYMVKSGLVNDPHVSQYRLTAHLGVAVAIYGYMLWVAFDLIFSARQAPAVGSVSWGRLALALVFLVYLMILSGGLVAGTRAGFAYSTWPLMGTSFVPPGLYSTTPAWLAAFEDITTIQFNHRMFAYVLFVVINGLCFAVYRRGRHPRERLAAGLLSLTVLVQVCLGITTLLLHVPVAIAAAHQGGAVLVFSAALFLAHVLNRQTSTA